MCAAADRIPAPPFPARGAADPCGQSSSSPFLRVRLTQSLHPRPAYRFRRSGRHRQRQLTEYAVQFFCRCKAECLSLAEKAGWSSYIEKRVSAASTSSIERQTRSSASASAHSSTASVRRRFPHADKHRFAGKRCQHAPSSAAGGDKNRLRRSYCLSAFFSCSVEFAHEGISSRLFLQNIQSSPFAIRYRFLA